MPWNPLEKRRLRPRYDRFTTSSTDFHFHKVGMYGVHFSGQICQRICKLWYNQEETWSCVHELRYHRSSSVAKSNPILVPTPLTHTAVNTATFAKLATEKIDQNLNNPAQKLRKSA